MAPAIDRDLAGYVACLNCGHNGVLSEGEAQHLALHLRRSIRMAFNGRFQVLEARKALVNACKVDERVFFL